MTATPSPDPGPKSAAGRAAGSTPVKHFLVQAPVPAMDVDGLLVTTLGLVAFAIASVLTGLFYDDLHRDGNGWWLGVSLSGFALGLVGLAYCRYRQARRRAGHWDRD